MPVLRRLPVADAVAGEDGQIDFHAEPRAGWNGRRGTSISESERRSKRIAAEEEGTKAAFCMTETGKGGTEAEMRGG